MLLSTLFLFVLSASIPPPAKAVMDTSLKIILSVATPLAALGIGLILRRLLIHQLKKTVLDNWINQTLGVVVALLPLIPGTLGVLVIWDTSLLFDFLWTTFRIQDPQKLISPTGQAIYTLLIAALGIGAARTIKSLIMRGLSENRIDINIRTLIGRIFYFIILIFTFFLILSTWNIPLGIPVAAIGVITIAVTVSIQDVLKDLVAGFYILVERPFYIGNQISITAGTNTYLGRVEDVQLRATKLRLVSGEEVTIPNSLVFGGSVVNNSYYGERRATLSVVIPEEDFVEKETPRQILQALKNMDSVDSQHEPSVLFTEYSEQKFTLTVHFWIANASNSTVSDVMYILHTILPSAALSVREPAGNI